MVFVHCAACFAFFQPARCALMYAVAHSVKVIERAASSALLAAAALRASMGSTFASKSLRQSEALLRASASPTVWSGPNPISRALPASVKRNSHDLLPDGLTCK